ncbi:MAG: hypothetical protein IIC97_09235 [Chloroflexi bacterium]|nr:hypothetical protein [Chloroflexota bacterium]
MAQEQPEPQEHRRPWYYSTWFLALTFILGWPIQFSVGINVPLLWPAWSVLILRSPWHRNFITGTVAWAMLMSGGFLVIIQFAAVETETELHTLRTVIVVAPGLILTAVTQFFWTRDRRKIDFTGSGDAAGTVEAGRPPRIRQPRQVRRQRRRGSRPGRSSRHPF